MGREVVKLGKLFFGGKEGILGKLIEILTLNCHF